MPPTVRVAPTRGSAPARRRERSRTGRSATLVAAAVVERPPSVPPMVHVRPQAALVLRVDTDELHADLVPVRADLTAPPHLALDPERLAVELEREVVDGADLEGGGEVEQGPAQAEVEQPGRDLGPRGAGDGGAAHAPARWRSRSRKDSRRARSSASTFTNEMPMCQVPGAASGGCSMCTTRPRRSTVTWARLSEMSHWESMASGAAISRQAPSSERATTLKSAKTVARPLVRPSSRTRGWRRRSSSSRAIGGDSRAGPGGGQRAAILDSILPDEPSTARLTIKPTAALAIIAVLLPSLATPEVLWLRNGDRLTGT